MKNAQLPPSETNGSPKGSKMLNGLFQTGRLLLRPSTLLQLPRLLDEGFAPVRRLVVQAFNNSELGRLAQEPGKLTFVCSYGRSGNTWMRYLMSDVLLQLHGIETATGSVQPERLVPDYYADRIASRMPAGRAYGNLIKTHDTLPLLRSRFPASIDVGKLRFLYIFRAPEDVLVSLYHFALREKYIRTNNRADIDLLCLEFLPSWVEHVTGYLDAFDAGLPIHLVSYEEMLKDTASVLSDSLNWAGIPHPEAVVVRAESNMRFGKLQALEARTIRGGSRYFRRGVNGSGASELKPETLSAIEDASRGLMLRARDRLASQQQLRGQMGRSVTPAKVNIPAETAVPARG